MLKNTYTKWCNRVLERLFGRALTVSLIRHAYINTLDFNKLTIKEKEEIANGGVIAGRIIIKEIKKIHLK